MEGIILVIVIVLLIVFVVPIMISSSTNGKITALSRDLNGIKNQLRDIKEALGKTTQQPQEQQQEALLRSLLKKLDEAALKDTSEIRTPETSPSNEPDLKENLDVPYPIPDNTSILETKDLIQEDIPEEPEQITVPEAPAEEIPKSGIESVIEEAPEAKQEWPGKLVALTVEEAAENRSGSSSLPPSPPKRTTNFEQFIGEKLISIVGITILVLGIFFSVKWAIDRHLISDAGKIMIGVVSGTLLIGIAHRLSSNYRAFSSILAGGGIAVLYFSIYEAYQAYHLLPQSAAFGIMVFITLITVILSIIYDKKELAIIAIVGGFGTPFFVSNGAGNYKILFSYLLILNIGMFLLANFKKWNLVNIICYLLTLLIFGVWTITDFNETNGQASYAFLFSSLFFLVFFGMHIIYNLKHQKAFGYGEILLLLSNSLIYLGAGLYFLNFIHEGKFQGIFTMSLAIFNFLFAYIFYKRKNIDKNLVYLLVGLVLTFLSLTGPLQLDGNYITLFWACELIIVYWMGTKTSISLLKNASILVLILTLISLIMDWNMGYFAVQINKMPVLVNKAFITSVVVCLSLFLYKNIVKKDESKTILYGNLELAFYNRSLTILLIALVYVSLSLEIRYQSFALTQNKLFMALMQWNYHIAFVLLLAYAAVKKAKAPYLDVAILILSISILIYPLSVPGIISLRNECLSEGNKTLYNWHYIMPVLILISTVFIINYTKKNFRKTDLQFTAMAWLATAIIVFTLSVEAVHIWVTQSFSVGFAIHDFVTKANKVALPIIWAVCSLALMLLGMRERIKTLRIISLSLFSLTILKLFTYDISNVGQGGKIAAFIILGVILLIVSFMYQKIKGLFADESNNNDIDTTI